MAPMENRTPSTSPEKAADERSANVYSQPPPQFALRTRHTSSKSLSQMAQHMPASELSLDQFVSLTLQLGAAQNEISHLKDINKELKERIKELEVALSEEKNKVQAARAPVSNPTASLPLGSSTPSRRNGFVPTTPSSKPTPGSGGFTRRRHGRTETPDQRSLAAMLGPQFTLGMLPQDDRGLLNDFFDAIKSWADYWTLKPATLPPEVEVALVRLPTVKAFLRNTQNRQPIVADLDLRSALVASIVSRDIAYYGMCDHFLYNSGHPGAGACDDLFSQYNNLATGNVEEKQRLLSQQKTLYTTIKNETSHREWRAEIAWKRSGHLIGDLGPILESQPALNRHNTLNDLFIKGYRVGFRMRMETSKWQMAWPLDGDDFDFELMVNQSHDLCGDALRTLSRIQEYPGNFTVRFGKSPTIIKSDFSTGVEVRTVIHKAMVYLEEKQQFIGVERRRRGTTVGANNNSLSGAGIISA
ncbi:hypothetical protein K469DRAFT_744433 [Zopfia rhizophila CBS 207.26]|uniref:Uncharacterized protein n=1 Tax=Zopfia rhizophila CBS 207.26 TaxID=1314779 RepID=A0A6A6ETJ7_9PEZI|nr:hypothetical protein K469DRAFT_744433 [Zopfia rhizophila CBS 207.26]